MRRGAPPQLLGPNVLASIRLTGAQETRRNRKETHRQPAGSQTCIVGRPSARDRSDTIEDNLSVALESFAIKMPHEMHSHVRSARSRAPEKRSLPTMENELLHRTEIVAIRSLSVAQRRRARRRRDKEEEERSESSAHCAHMCEHTR